VVKLRKFRRRQRDPVTGLYALGDQLHFLNVGSLYPKLGECEDALLPSAIRKARLMYPYTGAEVQTTLRYKQATQGHQRNRESQTRPSVSDRMRVQG